jgi:DNA-directed RNA polymerase subunit M/transcription elongation factor TFIIS
MRMIGGNENMANCVRMMYEGTKFCVKCGENEITTFAPQTRGLDRGAVEAHTCLT